MPGIAAAAANAVPGQKLYLLVFPWHRIYPGVSEAGEIEAMAGEACGEKM